MSPTNSTEGNWILLQSRYDYIALPVELAVEVMKHMRVVSKSGNKIELTTGDVNAVIISGDQMTVALVKSKVLPKEEGEDAT
jgi:hypothetical protein